MLSTTTTKIAARSAALASRGLQRTTPQRRGIIDYLTKYPDRVMELKKIQVAGGTCQGDKNPTWLKQPGDQFHAVFSTFIVIGGLGLISNGFYKLATGKGKMD